MDLHRPVPNPVLRPRSHVRWERNAVFNTAVIHEHDVFHLFYRGVFHEGTPGTSNRVYTSCIGHARSLDGIHFQCEDEPVLYARTYANGNLDDPQDPRVVKIEDTYYMVYTNHVNCHIMEPHYAVSEDLEHWEEKGPLFPYEEWGHDKNAVLFPRKINGQFIALHRPEDQEAKHLPAEQFHYDRWSRDPEKDSREVPGVMLSRSEDLVNWTDTVPLMYARDGLWDNMKIGPGAPPVETSQGWLTIYHGIDHDHVYRLGVIWLDKEDPAKILHRQEKPILGPELQWEREGDVPDVVFTCGACEVDGKLWVYYGGADTVIGVATFDMNEIADGEK